MKTLHAIAFSLLASLSMATAADLRIQGSNTIGANLGPALVSAMLAEQGLHDIHSHQRQHTE